MKRKISAYSKKFNTLPYSTLSFNNPDDISKIDSYTYNKFLKDLNTKQSTKKIVTINHLENIFTNRLYYIAMKHIPLQEKKVLYLSFIKNENLNTVCNIFKISKKQAIKLKVNGIKHFKENVKKYEKDKN